MKKNIRNILFVLISFAIGFGIMYYLFQNFEAAYLEECKLKGIPLEECDFMEKLVTDFKSASPFWIFIVLFTFTISNVSRAMRWKMLLEPMGYRPKLSNCFFAVITNYFVNLFIPRMGEFMRAAVFTKFEKVPLEKGMGTVVIERTMDVICLLGAVGIAFLLEFDTLWGWLNENMADGESGGGLWSNPFVIATLSLGGIALIGFFIFRKQIQASAFYQKIVTIILGFWEGLSSVFKLNNPGLFIFHSIFIWVMYYIMTYLCFFAFAPTEHLTPIVGLMVFVFGAFGIVIPSPGGMGTYHWLVVQALAIYGINQYDAFSFANISFFSIQILCNVSLGIISIILLFLFNKNYTPKHEISVTERLSPTSTDSILDA